VTALQTAALAVVVLAGTGVVVIAEPLRQALALGVYGIALTVLFMVFQAPDVALSELVVSGIALPLLIVATLRKLGAQERAADDAEAEEPR
jgi:uncharacterized MnhB-related membrane protein